MTGRRTVGRTVSSRGSGLGFAAALVLVAGCGSVDDVDVDGASDPAHAPASVGPAAVGGRVVSTVDGHPITVDQVAAAARAAGVTPEVALRRLQDEALLAAAARRAGAGVHEGARGARQVMVQALLAEEVERRVRPDAIDAAELEAAYQANLGRFERPEQRESVHLLARVTEGAPAGAEAAARAWIAEQHRIVSESPDPEAAVLAFQSLPPRDRRFEVLAERVPPQRRAGAADPAYLAALFRPDGPGVVDAPVQTSFGWHVVVVTEVEPAWEATREEALATLRDERLAALRHARLGELLSELAARTAIEVDPEAVSAAIDGDALEGVEAP